jgi:signal transduction histidine kinase
MKEYFSVILQDTGRLARLVGNLLDFSRIEEGRKEYEFAPTDMVEWLRQTVDDFRQETIGGTVEVRIHVDGEIPAISIDRAAMSQALSNLLDNAAKFSAEDRRVDLRVEHRDAKVIIAVQDHGIGIPEHERTKIFEKFHQGPAPPGKSARGTGLGLTLVKHTVEAHGGTITVESQTGRGSTFVVTLPVRGTPEEGAHG